MVVPRVLSALILLLFICRSVSAIKNDRGGSSFSNRPNFNRHSRRNALNEYLVPPPPPRNYPVRSGRVVNQQPIEPPGYFSKFMDWINPFGYGSSPPTAVKSLPYVESPFPAAPPPISALHLPPAPQPSAPLHPPPAPQPSPPLHLPPAPQPSPPLYPPLGAHRNQHSGLILTPPLGAHPGPLLSPPPNPSIPTIYNAPPTTLYEFHHAPPNNYGAELASNKRKPCNPCNKAPWIPMQTDGLQIDPYPSPTASNAYLPPSNPVHRDTQHAASQEIKIPDPSHTYPEQNRQPLITPLPSPHLQPGPIAPIYKPEPFDRLPETPNVGSVGYFQFPPSTITPLSSQDQKVPSFHNEQLNNHGNHDLTSSGTYGNHGIGIIKESTDSHQESFGTSIIENQPPISGPPYNQEYHNPSVLKQEHRLLNEPIPDNHNAGTSFGSSNLENYNLNSQNSDVYRESFNPPIGNNDGLNYLPPSLHPASFGTSTFSDKNIESINYQYPDDLSASSSIAKNSHATTQAPFINGSPGKDSVVHFEESPLLDLTEKSEDHVSTYLNNDDSVSNTVKTTINYLETDNTFFEDTSSHTQATESYASLNIQNIGNNLGTSTPATFIENSEKPIETSTITAQYISQQDVSYISPSRRGYLWTSLLDAPRPKNESSSSFAQWNNTSTENQNFRKQDDQDSNGAYDTIQRQQNVKRNKQVQVIIPYTSEYTPIPFQQSYGDRSIKTNFDRTQARKVPQSSQYNIDNYVPQESRNEVRLINRLHSDFNFRDSNKLNVQSARPLSKVSESDTKSTTIKANNNSIDVRRLQKNIDNWTIQEYSKPTTSSTILPSSLHPYLLPSKKIPTEYFTTTEPSDHRGESNSNNENVKSYSLAGFSFNEVEHEGSASNHVEVTQTPPNISTENFNLTSAIFNHTDKPTIVGSSQLTWQEYSVSISPVNKERVYVVTPQPTSRPSIKNNFDKQKEQKQREQFQETGTLIVNSTSINNLTEFEAIEKAYQVLPQAVNNLAVASTGKEDVPLWGIMEHEEFASLNSDETDEDTAGDIVDRPILYSGHSKVSRAKR